jgi:uncharacterized protein YggE
MYRRVSFIVLSISVFMTFTCMVFAEEESKPSTIEVAGKASIMAMPNLATISFSVETNATKAKQAVSENAKSTEKLLNILRRTAGNEARISTSGFTLSPMYDRDNRLRPRGYQVRNTVILETKSIDKLGTCIDEASVIGVSRIASLTFGTDKEEQLRKEAAVKAVYQAVKIADDLARAAGLTIKKVIKLSYGPREPVRPYRVEAMAAAARTPIEIGEITIEERVNIVFEAN